MASPVPVSEPTLSVVNSPPSMVHQSSSENLSIIFLCGPKRSNLAHRQFSTCILDYSEPVTTVPSTVFPLPVVPDLPSFVVELLPISDFPVYSLPNIKVEADWTLVDWMSLLVIKNRYVHMHMQQRLDQPSSQTSLAAHLDMRLISTQNLKVVSIREDEIPPYAILSHTWDDDEITLQDMQGFGTKLLSTASRVNLLKAKQGLQKVLDAAKLAASEGHEWIWIDTCCIDKTSSAELSEAINSMYRWYQGSEICYVYLADAILRNKELQKSGGDSFGQLIRDSRWITRGWTLQELIAPPSISFYSGDWSFLGKSSEDRIMRSLAEATGVDIGVLSGDIATQEVSVANRMRWASNRKTTRPEDMAYCLMGLFSVNMPLMYGEGGVRSFIRLQNEILQATDDQTIFAWSTPPGSKDHIRASGLLAESPVNFRDAPSMYPMSDWYQSESSTPWSMTNRGLMVQLYLQPSKSGVNTEQEPADDFLAVLNCSADITRVDNRGSEWVYEYSPAISLRRLWGDQFARVHGDDLRYVRTHDRQGGQVKTLFVKQDQSLSLPSFAVPERFLRGTGSFIVSAVYPRDLWDSKSGVFRSGLSRQRCIQGLFRFSYSPGSGITDGLFDVAVALQSTAPGQFEAVGILRPTRGRTVRQAYDFINKVWLMASQDYKPKIADEYRDKMTASLQLRRTQRLGGVSYVLDLVEKAELQDTVSTPHPDAAALITLEGLKVSEAPINAGRQLRLLFKPICVSETSQPGRLIAMDDRIRVRRRKTPLPVRRAEMLRNLESNLSCLSTSKSIPVSQTSLAALRHCWQLDVDGRWMSAFQDINCDRPNTEYEMSSVCSQIVAGLAKKDDFDVVVREDGSGDIDERVRYGICEDWLVHFTALRRGPQFASWVVVQNVDFEADVFKGTYIASILGNAMGLRELLKKLKRKADVSDLSSIREQLGAVKGTQDTALHLAATYSTKKEFERIMTTLTRAKEGPEPCDDFDIKCKWSYLFRLQNGNRETVLHRAAAMSNFGVVSYICEHAPEVACELDFMNRSTLWHAACGGDHECISIIGTTLKSLKWAPTVDYPDDNGLTPLHVACREGYAECVEALLDLGANPRCAAQSSGLTPIHYASLFGRVECLRAMAKHPGSRIGFNQVVGIVEDVDLIRPIHLAAANGWAQCVSLLAEFGSPLEPLASVMCIARVSPSDSGLVNNQSSSDSLQVTEVQVQEIQLSTPKEVAAKRGWDLVVSVLEEQEGPLLSRSTAM